MHAASCKYCRPYLVLIRRRFGNTIDSLGRLLESLLHSDVEIETEIEILMSKSPFLRPCPATEKSYCGWPVLQMQKNLACIIGWVDIGTTVTHKYPWNVFVFM
jgi:hypothetical protein